MEHQIFLLVLTVTGVVTATFTGNYDLVVTVNGTQTIINTTSLEISDKTIGIGSQVLTI
jgi:hypothetical protein